MKRTLLVVGFLVLLLAGCASGPTIVANTNPGTDFSSFKTYNFFKPLGTDRAGGVRTPLSSRLVSSMNRALISRGMSLDEDPDLLVDFVVSAEDRIDVRTTPSHTVQRSHWNRGFSTWPTYNTTVRQYTEGTLIIDLIDPATNTLVGEGAAQNRITNTDFTQQQLDEIVNKILDEMMPR
ncbi:MAG: DUF4136 domain-containing protein [Xanthomonadales bacterium]|jgi:hypothetical protein|nr:DUF4136 domain-containing protein [Xanthomonadales bacterium]MDH3941693.1 DUF4136 domain-containing protein [Xanthomonadales bacterium]MDH4002343.1 DUF4136 domain-containing protein [Xanthomonadales bacterium]